MKRFIILVFLTIFVNALHAQLKVANEEEINKFFKTKTIAVLSEDMLSDYDEVIQDAMKKYWTITEYDFIAPDEFEKAALKKEYSFLVMSTIKVVQKKTDMTFKIINFALGGNSADLNLMVDLGSVPVLFEMYDAAPTYFKLASIIQFIQKNIVYLKENPGTTTAQLIKHYNDQKAEIQKKELWLLEEELEPEINSIDKITKVYPFPVKIVTPDELKTAIDEQNPNVCFLYKIAAIKRINQGKTIKMILSTQGDLYYIDQHTVSEKDPDALLKSDLMKIR